MANQNVKVVLGAMAIGKPGAELVRFDTIEDESKVLDIFQGHGHKEVDTARLYGAGSSEEHLANLEWQKRGLVMDTKLYPTLGKLPPGANLELYTHKPEDLRRGLLSSLAALKAEKVDMWYMHGPDRNTPFIDTLREVNNLHQEGYFARFGISNYHCWEVAAICEICDRHGWIKPTVYQGMYNVFHRGVEYELFPCLRKYDMSFYAYNPLAGGMLSDRYHRDDSAVGGGARFDPEKWSGKVARLRYWNNAYFDALDILRPVVKKYALSEADVALRWLAHHSQLKGELGDAVVVGASSTKHLEENLAALEAGPLPTEVVEALDAGWQKTRAVSFQYWL
ncbi:Aflatoxin B1 aldehyde reductase member [Lachnellula occidentalis]|uniref:Aflatoxin B1 aldehyde reductase member n=1 Tax=Lachnellula occidentalis TaxID=215460 RepID=A0A8H8RB87_9HELO|nr:Aflatoxin B1 aldehyde reductase member [Lachnellula occidentalis]